MSKTKILVVEDDEVYHLDVEERLNKAGFETRWTDATSVAETYLDSREYSLLMLDVFEIRRDPYGPLLKNEGYAFCVRCAKTIAYGSGVSQ